MALARISDTINIFFSLAPKDTGLFKELHKHLRPLMLQGLIEVWSDSEISAGTTMLDSIKDQMSVADIIVLLLSADFFDSDQCVQEEVPYAQEQHKTRATTIIPVLLRPMLWEGLHLERTSLLPQNGTPVILWDNLDNAFTDVAKGIQRVAEEIARRVSSIQTAIKRPQSPLRTLPYRRNPYFTDRDEILKALRRFFTTEQAPQTKTQALHGIGGIGKTALATEYACLYYGKYLAIFWLNATSPEHLSSSILFVADQMGIPTPADLNEQQRFAAIKQWLQSHDRWLVVLDDVEDFRLMDQFIPLYSEGHVLLTTQAQAIGPFATAIPVDQMDVDDGTSLLLRRSKPASATGSPEAFSEAEILQAGEIAQEFAGYPLALDQAGAYIEENRCSLASYLARYRQQKVALLSRRGRLAHDHLDPVTTTLSLSLQKIVQVDPLAIELLHLLAFLHHDTLPDEMFIHGASSLDGPLRKLALNYFAFDDAMNTLQRFSLVHRRTDSTMLRMHQILQVVIKQELTKKQQQQLAKQAVRLVYFIFPDVLFTNWKECERYMPQAQHCAILIGEFKLTIKEGPLLLERLGFYCYQRGSYVEAEKYLRQALSIYKHQRHADALDYAQTFNSLGLLYRQQARYKDAETLHRQVLALRERVLEADHPKIMESWHNLAMIYGDLGKYQQAEHLYQRVLAVEEKTKGPDHPDVADTLNELGLTYTQQGRFADAKIAYLRALAIYEQVRDADHPDLTYPLDGLGNLAEQRGDYQNAKSLYQRALTICEKTFGEQHPETAHSISKLAGIAALEHDYQYAETHYQQALTIYEQTLGSTHPDVALILNDKALLAVQQKDYQKAEPLYQRALAIYEVALGSEHPSVASVLYNMGQLLRVTGNKEQAKELLQRALTIREKALDATHPAIAQSLNNLADLTNPPT